MAYLVCHILVLQLMNNYPNKSNHPDSLRSPVLVALGESKMKSHISVTSWRGNSKNKIITIVLRDESDQDIAELRFPITHSNTDPEDQNRIIQKEMNRVLGLFQEE